MRVFPFSFALGLALFISAQALDPSAQAQGITTSTPHALVMDTDSRTVLFEKSADVPVAPASIAKLMTAELVFRDLKKGAITLDTQFYISEHAWKSAQGQASMFARVNTNIRVEDLLRGLIVQHGNDAAIALAEGLGGSEESFAAMMNVRAAEIGMNKTHFTDPWGGPDPTQLVTARDMAVLAQHVIDAYPEYYHFFGEKEFTWSKIRQLNRNPILLNNDLGADGLTVGNMPGRGFNLVGSAVQHGQRLIVVLLDAAKSTERNEEARRLFNWGFHGFDSRNLFAASEAVGVAKVYGGEKSEVVLVSDTALRLMIPRGSSDRLTGKIVYNGPLIAPVAAGQTVARLKIYRGTTLALDVPLKTGEAVEQGPLTERAKDAALELGLQLFHKTVDAALHKTPKPAAASPQ